MPLKNYCFKKVKKKVGAEEFQVPNKIVAFSVIISIIRILFIVVE